MSIQNFKKSKVLIVVEASEQELAKSLKIMQTLSVLKQAIATTNSSIKVEVVAVAELNLHLKPSQIGENENFIICPSLNLPVTLNFVALTVYQACRDVVGLRQRVTQQLGYSVNDGCFWLPIVNTAKGTLYGEVIAIAGQTPDGIPENFPPSNLSYYQPFHLSDLLRQQLYLLGFGLLQLLSAPPATYLMQFGFQGTNIYFDRIFPFPATPAIASVGVQQPDLFACHWYCISHLPISDLLIVPPITNHVSSLS